MPALKRPAFVQWAREVQHECFGPRACGWVAVAVLAGLTLLSVPAAGSDLSNASTPMIVAVRARRSDRCHRAHRHRSYGADARSSHHHRECVGAGGTTATTRASKATNDGYTLITGHMGTHAASVPLYPKLAYHPEKDFEPVGLLAGTPILILARKDFPPKDLKEFITYVKANESKVNAAHAGVGSVSNVSCELLNSCPRVSRSAFPSRHRSGKNALVGRASITCATRSSTRAADQRRHDQSLCHRDGRA